MRARQASNEEGRRLPWIDRFCLPGYSAGLKIVRDHAGAVFEIQITAWPSLVRSE